MKTKVYKIDPRAVLPTYGTSRSAGLDICALEDTVIHRPRRPLPQLVRTGLVIIPPLGFNYLLYPRSSLGKKYPGIVLSNSVGVIDEDYTGIEDELLISLLNLSDDTYCIKAGAKIAQLVLRKNYRADVEEISYEHMEKRGNRGGFGSTG